MPTLKPAFLIDPLPFEEAIQFFRGKVPLTPEEFYTLAEEYRGLAFTVSGVTAMDVLTDIARALEKAMTEGSTLKDFMESLDEVAVRRGWDGLSPYRADNVFRTNIMTALNVGRYRQQTDPDVVAMRPFWQYDAVNDRQTRPTHRALDGRVFPANDPFWDTWYPPNGYRCRCGVRTLTEAEVRRNRLTVSDRIPNFVETDQGLRPLIPDQGFAVNPARTPWHPDLEQYPPPLRQAFQSRRNTPDV